MRKAELKLLADAFSAEIDAAKTGCPALIQPESKLAEVLAKKGYLKKAKVNIGWRPPVMIHGYVLTEKGRNVIINMTQNGKTST